jgi:UPF0755 protein
MRIMAKSRHPLRLALILIPIMIVLALVVWWIWQGFQPVSEKPGEESTFVVTPGSSVTAVSYKLRDAGFIRSPRHFQFIVWQKQLTKKIQAGSFQLTPDLPPDEVAQRLTVGSTDVWVTLKEGWRTGEMGDYLSEKLENFSVDDPAFTAECLEYEGYLYPETYLVPLEFTTAQMCQLLRSQFDKVVTDQLLADAQAQGMSEQEVITLASIVVREAKRPDDMKIVAGILQNRLEIGMPLQVDATLQYIKGYDEENKTWWPTPLAADKQLDSPYNTYQNASLPPGPIANPGEDAIKAVVYPTPSDYLYYISNSAGTQMHYARTYEEHQENIARYLR